MGRKMTPLERLEKHLHDAQIALRDLKNTNSKQLSFADPPPKKGKREVMNYQRIVNMWNSQSRLHKNKKITNTLKKLIRETLIEYNETEIRECFEKYNTILGDDYWFEYDKWTLTSFLKSNNGFEKIFDNDLSFYARDNGVGKFGKSFIKKNFRQMKVSDVEPTIMMELAVYANKKNTRDLEYYRKEIKKTKELKPEFNAFKHYDSIKESIDPLVKQKIDRIIKYNT